MTQPDGAALLLPPPAAAQRARTNEEGSALAAWQDDLVAAASIQHALQLQLRQLALIHDVGRQRVKKRVVRARQLDGAAAAAVVQASSSGGGCAGEQQVATAVSVAGAWRGAERLSKGS